MDDFTKRRLKENEVIFREANKGVLDFVEEETESDDTKVDFYCECSQDKCRQRIRLSTRDYRKLHQSPRQFIAISGHEIPDIEKIISKQDSFNVVEKTGKMPSVDEIGSALTKIAVRP